ncbi:CHAT domain-containing protein [Peribacillus frigoritolerans]|uniref:CHAT domain-containing protein n=1 Tax=Peribacillus frigoritolerans TaxID=450367 RepID=UPI0021D12BA5|nr:CHAT domain-containing protein [Peribacillus frigoritolerans]MCU6603925.1 CHAT domain-containing protein [Peribacillus frigoritolerans]
MKENFDKSNKLSPTYYIIYKAEKPSIEYSPIINYPQKDLDDTMHLFDPELSSALIAINYCLHLPRINFDLSTLRPSQIKSINTLVQNIIIIPSYGMNDVIKSDFYKKTPPTILIVDDFVFSEVMGMIETDCKRIEMVKFSDLSPDLLKDHWKTIVNYSNGLNDIIDLVSYPKSNTLPILHFADQIDKVDKSLNQLAEKSLLDVAKQRWKLQGYLDTMNYIEETMSEGEIQKNIYSLAYPDIQKLSKFPITLSIPGIPRKISKVMKGIKEIPTIEKEVLNLMGIHNAIANNGMYVSVETIPSEWFSELYKLEDHCKGNVDNRFIWRSLRKLGKLISEHFTDDMNVVLKRASYINAFTDFPIGLAILPETDSPLCCHKPISYKPITPLTRALQIEMQSNMPVYLKKGIKVLIAECLGAKDRIRKYSDGIWNIVKDTTDSAYINIVYKEITSSEELKTFLKQNSDAAILIISAHGYSDTNNNFAGLCIGDKEEIWLATDEDFIPPPVVLLSACHVSPRSTGAVSVADLFLRSGARTVLGTLIPVDVNKNGLLMLRLLIYIVETLKGNYSFKTLTDVWQFVVASNAVNEVLSSTKALKYWGHTKRKDGTYPLGDFQKSASIGRLQYTNVYSDTITILKEIAERDKVLDKLNNAMKMDNYFPESVFYQFIGSPEVIMFSGN